MRIALLLSVFLSLPAAAQTRVFDWLGRIDAELPAIEACARDHPSAPVGVAALFADGPARHLLLRDASGLVWSCRHTRERTILALEPDPASDNHKRPIFWLRRYGEPWAECWDAREVRTRTGALAGWFVVQTC
jgi:hypothetical protein